MAASWLPLIILLVGGITAAPAAEEDSEDVELILVANAGLEDVLEGDILLDNYTRHVTGQAIGEEENSVPNNVLPGLPGGKQRKRAVDNSRQWLNGIIPYTFSPFLGEDVTKAIHGAMNDWMEKTCVKFVPRTNEADYIMFVKEEGCRSFVGRAGGEQKLTIGDDTPLNSYCRKRGILLHELGHAIGFWHEQSRPDRDKYIKIEWDNIREQDKHNFLKYSHGIIDSLGQPYDYDSIMHYSRRASSKNGQPTIIPKMDKVKIGQRKYLSFSDIAQANMLYKCPEKRPTLIELPILIQTSYGGACIQANLVNGGKYVLLLSDCNQNNSMQRWKWNEENQLYNPVVLQCISSRQDGLLELRNCTSGDTLQQWLCANHFIEQPSNGNCIAVSKHSHQLIVEKCNTEKNMTQTWNKYNNLQSEIENSILHLLGDNSHSPQSICAPSGYHTVVECYNEKIHLGWSVCNRLGFYVTGLSHLGILHLITEFKCCYTPHVFTGQLETPASIEEEVCVNEIWWSFLKVKGWFRCPTGYYFKGYFKGGQNGWHAIQQVRCCKAARAPLSYQDCYMDDTDGSNGQHKCSRAGHHIAGVYKTDCSFINCVEQLFCCV